MTDQSENRSGTDEGSAARHCYAALPVTELIDHFLTLIRDAPIYSRCRRMLIEVRDDIFLELPETRTELLCRVGHVINECVPSGEPNSRIEDFWYEIRDIMQQCFAA